MRSHTKPLSTPQFLLDGQAHELGPILTIIQHAGDTPECARWKSRNHMLGESKNSRHYAR